VITLILLGYDNRNAGTPTLCCKEPLIKYA
jgi:hypothetical protein